MKRQIPRALSSLGLFIALVLTSACGSERAAGSSTTDAVPRIQVEEVYVPESVGTVAAAYMTIRNSGTLGDRLVGAGVDLASSATLHRTSMDDGMVGMSPVDAIQVPAAGSVVLEPGGYHVMLTDLTTALRAGDQVRLTLTFEVAGDIEVTADVLPATELP